MKIFDLLSLKSFEEGSPESSFEDKRLLDKNQRFLTLNFLNRNFKEQEQVLSLKVFEGKRLLDKNQRFLTLNFFNKNFKKQFLYTK